MQSTGAAPAAAAANPWQDSALPPRRRARRRTSRVQDRPIPPQRMRWTGAANIALTVLLIVAAFGAVRAFEGSLPFDLGGDNGPSEPRLAAIPGTPDESSLPAVQMTPEATPKTSDSAAFACDFSQNIPLFPDVSSSSVEGTSLYLTPRNSATGEKTGTLMLSCPEVPADIVLALNVVSASPGPWPGIVRVSVLPTLSSEPHEQFPAYVELQTGESISFSLPHDGTQMSFATASGSPWVVGPSVESASAMQVLDLRTMETTDLSSLIGDGVTAPGRISATGASENGTLAVSFEGYDHVNVDQATGTGTVTPGETARDAGLPGDILILGTSIDDAHWISLPDDLANLREMWISPDGSALAVASFEPGSEDFMSPLTYAVLDTSDGSELARSQPIEMMDNPRAVWIQDGSSIAFAAGTTVQTLEAAADAQPETVLEGDQQFFSVRTTTDPDVIVATIRADHDSDADPDSTDVDKVYSVNVVTGETHEFGGMELGNSIGWNTNANALLIYDFIGMGDGTVTLRVFDPVSGALIETVNEVPNPNNTGRMNIGKNSITSTDDGQTTAFAIGGQNIYVVTSQEDGPAFRQIEPPSAATGMTSIILAPDGTALSLVNNNDESRTRWALDLTDPAAEWLEIDNEGVGNDPGYIWFIEGTGD